MTSRALCNLPYRMHYAIVDIETTGNGLKGNKITEISIFKFDGEDIIDEFTSLVNPECPIPFFITGLTGIDDQMVRRSPTFHQIAHEVLEITKDCVFVAHAVNFDYGVIKEEFRQLGMDFIRKKLCTVRLSRKLVPGLQSYSLGKLCSAMGIPIRNRHRAKGDAEATVLLFKQLLQRPNAKKILTDFLNSRNQEATLPPHLDKKIVDKIPNKPGIYYFLDQVGSIIYVGKAKNLRKRVLGHFYDKSEHEVRLCREIANIDFELSGSELIALLMESAAIKEHFPKYNRAQKRVVKRYGIFSYEDRNGILHLGFTPTKQLTKPLVAFGNPTDCRIFLKRLCDDHGLCPKYCQLVPATSSSDLCLQNHCKGDCQNKEDIPEYNSKVRNAIASISRPMAQLVLRQPGRNAQENAFVLMENNVYVGYGFIDIAHSISSIEDLKAFLIPQKNTFETQRILENAVLKMDDLKTLF